MSNQSCHRDMHHVRTVNNMSLKLGRTRKLFHPVYNHCDYTDVGNGALRTSSMADTLTGSCLFVPISPIKRHN